jgi:hypothetical protein
MVMLLKSKVGDADPTSYFEEKLEQLDLKLIAFQ